MTSKILRVLLILIPFALCSCESVEDGNSTNHPADDTKAPRYEVKGRVVEVSDDGGSLTVAHERIDGLMEPMTMPFQLSSPKLSEGIGKGDEIQMSLETGEAWVVDAVKVLEKADAAPDERGEIEALSTDGPADESYHQLAPGDPVPEVRLTDQEGKAFALTQTRGKKVVLSFIYTRCPMPQLCPLITRRFAALQNAMDPTLASQTQILLVTIDPQQDTPEVLKGYAVANGLDLERVTLLTGPIRDIAQFASWFGLEFYNEEDGTIAHKMRVVLLDAAGNLLKLYKGPAWSEDGILSDLQNP